MGSCVRSSGVQGLADSGARWLQALKAPDRRLSKTPHSALAGAATSRQPGSEPGTSARGALPGVVACRVRATQKCRHCTTSRDQLLGLNVIRRPQLIVMRLQGRRIGRIGCRLRACSARMHVTRRHAGNGRLRTFGTFDRTTQDSADRNWSPSLAPGPGPRTPCAVDHMCYHLQTPALLPFIALFTLN